MSTHELEHNAAGDVVGTRPATCRRHCNTPQPCPYCKESEENERN